MALDYKQKYTQLLSAFVKATDTSYRLGFEDGSREAEMQAVNQQNQQMQQQMAAQQAQMQSMQGQGQDPNAQPEQDEQMQDQQMQDQQMQDQQMQDEQGQPNELDQKINELEQIVNKSEKLSPEIKKAIDAVSDIRKSLVIKASSEQKRVLSSQKKLVDNLVSKWGKEIEGTKKDIKDVLMKEGIKIE